MRGSRSRSNSTADSTSTSHAKQYRGTLSPPAEPPQQHQRPARKNRFATGRSFSSPSKSPSFLEFYELANLGPERKLLVVRVGGLGIPIAYQSSQQAHCQQQSTSTTSSRQPSRLCRSPCFFDHGLHRAEGSRKLFHQLAELAA